MMEQDSFTAVNYSLRPSKTIQRSLVFEGLRRLQDKMDWSRAVYIGFGSIWFTDFIMAHKILKIAKMISIEASSVGFQRAKFNRPYRFVRMVEGYSFDVLPSLFNERGMARRPYIIWLDYDRPLGEDEIDEIRRVITSATDNSVLLVTFDASEKHYGDDSKQRYARLRDLFGTLLPDDLEKSQMRDLSFGKTISTVTSDLMISSASKIFRDGGSIPAFNLVYKDKATMATVGVILPSSGDAPKISSCVRSAEWPGFAAEPIIAPHLTSKEVSVLQAKLPAARPLTRKNLKTMGFDLEDEQLQAFEKYYRHYPTFAQIMS